MTSDAAAAGASGDEWYTEGDKPNAVSSLGDLEPRVEPVIPANFPKMSHPLDLPKDRVRLLNYRDTLDGNNGQPEEIAFSARVWAQVSLPYKDPGEVPFWVRRNGDITLRVQPAAITVDGVDQAAYPFGILPRHIMTWMATEAVRTGNQELILGDTMQEFMEKLQVEVGGNSRKRLANQMDRVFGSRLSVEGLVVGADGSGYGQAKEYFPIAESTQLWFNARGEISSRSQEQPGLWDSKIVLSKRFFDSIIERPVPVDPGALQVLGSKPLTFDIYVWVSYRLYDVHYPTRISWSDLHRQFGSQTKRLRDFRKAFETAMRDIAIIMPPQFRYELEPNYFVLYPGPTPIEQTSKRRTVRTPRSQRKLRAVEPANDDDAGAGE
ncbi:replication protein RepA [Curtobacterium flaccumfaciens]